MKVNRNPFLPKSPPASYAVAGDTALAGNSQGQNGDMKEMAE
jgi:hypothetical protein